MKRVAIGALLITLLAGPAAMAGDFRSAPRDHDRHQRHERPHHNHRNDRTHRERHFDHRHHKNDNHGWRNGRYHLGRYHRPRGYVHHHWRRGHRLPRAYYARPYVIVDYHRCGLRAPPRGHHWVRVNNDAVLAVIATGVVLDVIYNRFW